MSTPNERTPREQETRAAAARPLTWKPPTTLPDPHPRPGLCFRWVRVSAMGAADPGNISNSFQEGWEPVRAVDYPELDFHPDKNSRWPENVEIGGLLLCSAPALLMKQRADYYDQLTRRQMQAVNDQLDRETDPRLSRVTRDSKTSVGFGPDARRERGA